MIQENNGPVFPVVIFPENIRKIIDTTHEESCFPVNYIAALPVAAVAAPIANSLIGTERRKTPVGVEVDSENRVWLENGP